MLAIHFPIRLSLRIKSMVTSAHQKEAASKWQCCDQTGFFSEIRGMDTEWLQVSPPLVSPRHVDSQRDPHSLIAFIDCYG
ncbi:hypothetical protein GDO86_005250 [Hymenochirus boettgeri]|uniref:Uncharacterized protein n=1 Tax=Hymenochirus boettgeri TaxID=247094 RepID=A0A8T2J8N1_9PIPI|nr:hypothetical protein GDO86_005250 [Hymenochirus boettgeri]